MAIPYELLPHHGTHPSALFAAGRWLGLDCPTTARSARILELGCAAGANLLPLAARIEGLQATGVDLSAEEVARGQALASAVGDGMRVVQGDVAEPLSLGTFDVVVVHGLYSWVSEPVADQLLARIAEHLAPSGVAYLSFNVAAGWPERMALREHLLAEAGSMGDPVARLARGRELLRSAPEPLTELGARLAKLDDGYLDQEFFSEHNHPRSLPEVADHLARHGLALLTDMDGPSLALGGPWHPARRAASEAVGTDLWAMEHWMDQATGRPFRAMALCRADAQGDRRGPSDLYLTTALRRVDGAPLDEAGPTRFADRWGAHTTIADPGVKAILGLLLDAWPAAVPFSRIEALAGPHAEPIVSILVGSNLVRASVDPGPRRERADRPVVPVDVRVLAGAGSNWAADPWHRAIRLDERDRALVPLLDGTRTAGDLAMELGWDRSAVDGLLDLLWDVGLRTA